MNDEASVHYEATIDQMTEGHQFLFREFGIVPKIGWQIGKLGTPGIRLLTTHFQILLGMLRRTRTLWHKSYETIRYFRDHVLHNHRFCEIFQYFYD